ncbi:MAG: hypothetical protein R3E31_01565 [Chloroflexota bacterium]
MVQAEEGAGEAETAVQQAVSTLSAVQIAYRFSSMCNPLKSASPVNENYKTLANTPQFDA